MTIEEYDSKKELMIAIDEIDKALCALSEAVKEREGIEPNLTSNRPLYALRVLSAAIRPEIEQRFKQLLIERKKELVEEFSR